MSKKLDTTESQSIISTYNKQQILNSKRYNDRRDLLSVLLENDKQYSHEDIEALIDNFMKGKVK